MEQRPAGRSRGRARGTTPQQPPAIAQPQGAWASRRPGPPAQPEGQEVAPTYVPPPSVGRSVRAPAPQYGPAGDVPPGTGRSTAPDGQATAAAVVPSGGGGDASTGGRGAMRGRKVVSTDALVTRPPHTANSKKGTTGKPLTLNANYFKIVKAPDWCLYQYRVDFAPEEDRTVVRKALVRQHKETLGTYLFDGTVLYTCVRLPNVTRDDALTLASRRDGDDTNIIITIKLVGDMARSDPHYLQLFNILMRKGLEHLKLQLVGRNYFDPKARVEIREHGFALWPGYLTSIRQHERDVLMCVEITHKVMRQQTVYQIMDEARANARGGDMQAACKAEVIGLTVLTDYNNNTYRVDDIDFKVNPKSTFSRGHGDAAVQTSYVDYYREKYNIIIRNLSQPLLVSRSTARDRRAGKDEFVYLVPELCRATGLTDSMRNNYQLMAAMAVHTRVNPGTRIEKLLGFNRRLMSEPNVVRDFNEWQLQVDRELVEVPARQLPPENIRFAKGTVNAGDKADWTMAFRNNPMLVSAQLRDWVIIYPDRVRTDVNGFLQMLVKAGQGMGFSIGRPEEIGMREDRPQNYTQQLEDIMSRKNPQLVFCVSLRQRADVYSAIKKKCCLDRPVPSQVFLAKNLNSKGAMSIATKVAIQMNCKIGGAPWTVDVPLPGLMVVGFDVCHDPNQRGTDFGAMVASLDKGFTRYFSAVSQHTSNEEMSNEFGANIIKAVKKFHEVNKAYPQRIIVYRDGVGEGQIPFVLEHEVANLRKTLVQFYGNPDAVKLAFVVVTKRINTRFFLNRRDNPPPGTVIDDVVTDPNRYDFFIVSQCVRQGSVTPTAYNVIDDNVGLAVDKMQLLTFKLCHMYFNWSGTVRVPAPCQFAHKLAFLVAQSIHRAPSTHLESLLYFL